MNKAVKMLVAGLAGVALLAGCNNKDPHHLGEMAGEASCECYRLASAEEVERCLDKIAGQYSEWQTDTAFVNAVEEKMLYCISDGIADLGKPLAESEGEADAEVLDTLTVETVEVEQ